MKKILAFSHAINSRAGGAEISTWKILNIESNKGNAISVVAFNTEKKKNILSKVMSLPKYWKLELINPLFLSNHFQYFEYLINRNKVKRFFNKSRKENSLITYSRYAPPAILGFNGDSTLYIRCEDDLAINENYHSGLKRLIKYLIIIIEYPALLVYKNDFKNALKKAKVICNSKFMQRNLKNIYKKDSIVDYPIIDKNELRFWYNKNKKPSIERGIVFVDGGIEKGRDIVIKIAKSLPKIFFYIFSKNIDQKKNIGNINYIPWTKNSGEIYGYANLVIVPAIGLEAYGRVSREAMILKIPVLVSDRGGLPESVDFIEDLIIKDYKKVDEWVTKITKVLS